jgi:hypothetical protein
VRQWLLPGWEEQQKNLRRLVEQGEKSVRDRAESEAHGRERLRKLEELVLWESQQQDRVDRSVGKLDRRLGKLQDAVRSQTRASESLWQRAGRAWAHVGEQQRILRRLDRLQGSKLPIVVGPWTGEIGFELLYWIPFLQWALASRGIDRDRVIAVSRGGAEIWYSHVAGRYVDLLDVISADMLREWTAISKKQRDISRFDVEVLRHVRRRVGLSRLHLLHPQLMYRLFLPIWRRQPAVSDIESFTQFKLFAMPPPLGWKSMLPARYVAMKVYFSLSFPPTEENRAFTSDLVRRVAERVPVVLLTSGVKLDDHDDWRTHADGRVFTIDHLLTPTRNLDVQTRVLAGAEAFIGTYGGFSYLAPFLGVPSISFFSRRAFFAHHLELADRVFGRLDGGRFLALETGDFQLLNALLRDATVGHESTTRDVTERAKLCP